MRSEAQDRLLRSLAECREALPRVAREFSEDALRRAPSVPAVGVETFSPIGHVCHLRDIEIDGYHVRIHRLRTEDRPLLASLPGEQLAVERRYELDDRERTLAAFVAARDETLAILGSVAAHEWDRSGDFEGYGAVTLAGLVEILAEHDAGHLRALRQLPRS